MRFFAALLKNFQELQSSRAVKIAFKVIYYQSWYLVLDCFFRDRSITNFADNGSFN